MSLEQRHDAGGPLLALLDAQPPIKFDPTLEDYVVQEGDTILVAPDCPPQVLADALSRLSSRLGHSVVAPAAPTPVRRPAHPNSLAAHQAGRESMGDREQAIIAEIRRAGPGTDRQLRDRIGLGDMNEIRPRVTELLKAGVLREVDRIRDVATGRMVRVVALAINPPTPNQ